MTVGFLPRQALAGLALVGLLLVAGPTGARPVAGDSAARVAGADGELVAGFVERGRPPFYRAQREGRYQGITAYTGPSVDYLDHVARRLNVPVRRVGYADEAALIEAVRWGEVDVAPMLRYTPSRARSLAFTRPYFRSAAVLVTRASGSPVGGVADLAGRRLALSSRSRLLGAVSEWAPEARVVVHAGARAALVALRDGQVDAYVGDAESVMALLDDAGFSGLHVKGPVPPFPHDARMAVARDRQALRDRLQTALDAISDGTRAAIARRWDEPAERTAGASLTLTPEQIDWLKRHLVIRVGASPTMSPYSYIDADGRHRGIVADYLRLIASRLPVNLRFVPGLPDRAVLARVRDWEVDVAAGFSRTRQRRTYMTFSEPLVSAPWTLVTGAGVAPPDSLTALAGRSVAVGEGSAGHALVRERLPAEQIVTTASDAAALDAVREGRAFAALSDLFRANHALYGGDAGDLRIGPVLDLPERALRFGVRSDWPELARILDAVLGTVSPAERARLRNRWLVAEQGQGVEWEAVARVAAPGVLALVALLATSLYWIRRLRVEVEWRRRIQADLAREKEEAEQATAAKARFLATMSHEIRTPMNGLLGMMELLTHTPLTPEQDRTVRAVRESGQVLLQIINDILDYSRLEAGGLELDPVPTDPRRLVETTAVTLASQAHDRGLALHVRLDPRAAATVRWDETRVRQILMNLLGNALKFTGSGHVSITLSVVATVGSRQRLCIEVEDSGAGIGAEALERLFEPFTQADAGTSRRHGGTGLGLSICRHLAHLLGGTLTLSSHPGQGTLARYGQTVPVLDRATGRAGMKGLVCRVVGAGGRGQAALVDGLRGLGLSVTVREPLCLDDAVAAAGGGSDLNVIDVDGLAVRLSMHAAAVSQALLAVAAAPVLARHGASLTGWLDDRDAPAISLNPLRLDVLEAACRAALGLEPVAPAAGPGDSVPEAPGRTLRLLVVEDHPTNRTVIRHQLERLGHEADLVASGDEALAVLPEGDYDVVLTDLHMPAMDGFELARAVRRREAGTGRRVPVIALTADSVAGSGGTATPELDDFLLKPISVDRLADVLERWCPDARRPAAPPSTPDAAVATVTAGVTLDTATLLESFGDRQTVREVLDYYRANNAEDLAALRAALASGDRERMGFHAHRLKSALRMVGAGIGDEVAEAVERRARSAPSAELSVALAALDDAVAALDAALVDYLASESDGDSRD